MKLSYLKITAQEFLLLQSNQKTDSINRKLKDYDKVDSTHLHQQLHENNVNYITIYDPEYPTLLKEIYDPPYILFYRGNINLLKIPTLGIVGSRKCTSYTRQALSQLFVSLSDIAIVSGLAYGADEYAHKAALEYQLPTIGVLAFGHGIHYPKTTAQLRLTVEQHGLTISEYPPETTVVKWRFIARNRIIAGLSRAVLVTEAEEKSGSLVTLEMAMDENRATLCLPGNITSQFSKGTNKILAEGAKMVLNSDDIMEEFIEP